MEGIPVASLIERFGSPLFIVSEPALRRRVRGIGAAFRQAWPHGDVVILPSTKANPVLALQCVLQQEGAGADLVHAGELEVAVRAGIDPARISLNGSGKDRATIERAIRLGVRVTIDDVREIELARQAARDVGVPARVSLRLRPFAETDALMQAFGTPITEAYGRYKSGIPHDDLAEAGKAIAAPELDVTGVMMHMGRYTTDLSVIGQFQRRFGELVAEVSGLWGGWTPRSIDIGGGFAPPMDAFGRARPEYDPPAVPSIEEYARTICAEFAAGVGGAFPLAGRTLELEPGRSLFAPCGIHAATVLNVKRQTVPFRQTWFETDTSTEFLSDIQHSFMRPPVVPEHLPDGAVLDDQGRVVGHSCGADVLAAQVALPPVAPGDVLAFCFTGAYHEAGASNFNLMRRPATVLACDGEANLIRRAETPDDLLRRDVLPDRLRAGRPEAAA